MLWSTFVNKYFLPFAYDWLLGVRNVTMIWREKEGKKFAIHGERMKWIFRVFSFWIFHLQKGTRKDERPHTYIIMMLEVMRGGNYTHSAHLTLKRFRRDSSGTEHSEGYEQMPSQEVKAPIRALILVVKRMDFFQWISICRWGMRIRTLKSVSLSMPETKKGRIE